MVGWARQRTKKKKKIAFVSFYFFSFSFFSFFSFSLSFFLFLSFFSPSEYVLTAILDSVSGENNFASLGVTTIARWELSLERAEQAVQRLSILFSSFLPQFPIFFLIMCSIALKFSIF